MCDAVASQIQVMEYFSIYWIQKNGSYNVGNRKVLFINLFSERKDLML